MIYSNCVRKAMILAELMHRGQYDKGGYPYIHHVMHLAEQAKTEEVATVCLLHDTVEDNRLLSTEYSSVALREIGIENESARMLVNCKLCSFYGTGELGSAIDLLCKTVGFSDAINKAWKLITRDKSITYIDYIKNLSANDIAREVKVIDLNHNNDISRLGDSDQTKTLRERYRRAMDILKVNNEED